MGLAVVLRDSEGNMLAARCEMRRGCLPPAAAEAQALLLAISLCREMGLERVQLEGDAKTVIDAVSSTEIDYSWMGHITEDIKLELNFLVHSRVSFVKREGNKVAHSLAKYAVRNCISKSWRDVPPACICDMLALEHSALVA
ncbi:uncharacterized protein LOC132164745 [Corylus avellana]|uniref:uncharacterized protein LOC132164745 n=1 Tax=Corylus avellana TaxID=13451 RepID=UPI00286B2901|nr:uncharacterized protein LOC132164745 [Corylus avellana]